LSLFASSYANDVAWYTKIHTKVGFSLYNSDYKGTLSNPETAKAIDFKNDFKYADTTSSFFSLEMQFDFPYIPNIYISYFNMNQTDDVDFNRSITFNDTLFNKVRASIDYKVLNTILFQEFKAKGRRIPFFNRSFYSGDIEFDIGANIKIIDYLIQMKDLNNPASAYRFDRVESTLILPYAGLKYYRYDLVLFANISSLSFAKSKATSYQFGVEYQVINNIYLGYGYMYEDFKATEKRDDINFKTAGNKFSIKFAF